MGSFFSLASAVHKDMEKYQIQQLISEIQEKLNILSQSISEDVRC